jgi:fused signal recognition particle receptor
MSPVSERFFEEMDVRNKRSEEAGCKEMTMTEEKTKKRGFFERILGKTEAERETAPSSETHADGVIDTVADPNESEQDEKKSFFRLKQGLSKTRSGFIKNLEGVLTGKKELDDEVVFNLEEVLVKADIGVKTAYQLLEDVTERVKRRELSDPGKVTDHLKGLIKESLLQVESPLRVGYGSDPFVVMVVGVNGSGKTTTIAKIAARHQAAGRKVLMAAGDTFRAAAVEQMEIWGERIGCPVVKGKENADPSSVAYQAVDRAIEEGMELVLVDTAGRLHTRLPLMEEMKKISRTLGKKLEGAPQETLLVIDASMGQNAILQATTFNEAIPVTGIALTKLDGTSKGGVLVGISNELKIPVRYIGIGEKMDDLRDFNAGDFAEALFATGESMPAD